MSDWQPMETAPRDGTPILAFSALTMAIVVFDEKSSPSALAWRCCSSANNVMTSTTEFILPFPKYWMPLPKKPIGYEVPTEAWLAEQELKWQERQNA